MRSIPIQLIYPAPVPTPAALTPVEIEQAADEAIQALCEKLAEVEQERDTLLAASIRMVEALDADSAMDLAVAHALEHWEPLDDLYAQIDRRNRERVEAHAALREAITDSNETGVSI